MDSLNYDRLHGNIAKWLNPLPGFFSFFIFIRECQRTMVVRDNRMITVTKVGI